MHRDFDVEKQLSYCVFCGVCRAPSQLQAAHLIPNSVSERYGLEVSPSLLGVIGGYFETTLNAVAACTLCHQLFDRGLIWAEPRTAPVALRSAPVTADTATLPWQSVPVGELVLWVDASLLSYSELSAGHGLRLPQAERVLLPFPVAPVWEWRRRWAAKKCEDELAKEMGKLGLSGPCERMGACLSRRQRNCARRMCRPAVS